MRWDGGVAGGSQPMSTMSEFKDPVFSKTSPKRSLSMSENQRFELVFKKTGSVNSGTDVHIM
jgi:hypothetical protein